jgi:hypothetical protein
LNKKAATGSPTATSGSRYVAAHLSLGESVSTHRHPFIAVVFAMAFALGAMACFAGSTGATTPTGSMTPSSGIVDLQRVTVRATGFPPHQEIQVLECSGTAQSLPIDSHSCEGDTLDSGGFSDANGNYINTVGDPSGRTKGYRVYVLPSKTLSVVSIQCDPTHPCLLYVGLSFDDFTQPHAFVPFTFKGAAAASSGHSSSAWIWALIGALIVLGLVGVARLLRRRRASVATNH